MPSRIFQSPVGLSVDRGLRQFKTAPYHLFCVFEYLPAELAKLDKKTVSKTAFRALQNDPKNAFFGSLLEKLFEIEGGPLRIGAGFGP